MARESRRVQARRRSPVYPVPLIGGRRPTGRRPPTRGSRTADPACLAFLSAAFPVAYVLQETDEGMLIVEEDSRGSQEPQRERERREPRR